MAKIKEIYLSSNFFTKIYRIITKHPDYIFYKAVKIHKKYRYMKDNNKKIGIIYYGMRANRMASKYNLELYGRYGENLTIGHGNIVINSKAILGDNVLLLGCNCIGEKLGKAPRIGNNVKIGFGSVILGDITIADDVIIGANSFVNKDILEKGSVVAGCPAKKIK